MSRGVATVRQVRAGATCDGSDKIFGLQNLNQAIKIKRTVEQVFEFFIGKF